MKKLLTMMVSCASALFAMADDTLSTAKVEFTNYGGVQPNGAAVSLNINKNDACEDGYKYWYSASAAANAGIAEAFVTNNGANAYLMLDTSDVLERTIKPWTQGETLNFVPQDITTKEIYFDSMVQFTATEDDVTPSEGDKLVVWLKAVEGSEGVEGSTNLMITAGNGVDQYNKAIRADFVASVASGVSIKPNSWHQLTIKAFVDKDGDTLFNVYIDKELVTGVLNGTPSGTDFESLVSKAEEDLNPTTITSVGFKGTGAVDDLLFTNENPLGFPVTATIVVENETEAFAKYSVDSGSTWLALTSGSEFTVPASTTKITFKVYTWDDSKLEGGTITSEIDSNMNIAWIKEVPVSKDDANIITLKVVAADPEPETGAFSIDGVEGSFATLAKAIEAAEANATIVVAKGADDSVTSYNVPAFKIEKSITIDLNGNTLVLTEPAVGASAATETLGLRIGGNTGAYDTLINVKFMNGTIKVADDNAQASKPIKMMINNYANLTLTNVTLDGTNLVEPVGQPMYVLSNNSGRVTLNGSTAIIVPTEGNSVAFDVCKFQTYVVPTVTLDTTGTIGGDVEVTGGKFVYTPGTITGKIKFVTGGIMGDKTAVEELIGAEGTPKDKVLGLAKEGEFKDYLVWVDKPADPELPKPSTDGNTEITVDYETEAEAAIKDAFTTGGTFAPPAAPLVVEVNGEVLLGNAAVEMINEVTKVFETEGKFFNQYGKMEVTFKATSADPDNIGYEAKVGGVDADVKAAYEVVPKYIKLATGEEIDDPGADATAKFFKLVIRAKSVQ